MKAKNPSLRVFVESQVFQGFYSSQSFSDDLNWVAENIHAFGNNSSHLLEAYYVPGTVLSALH